MTSEEKKITLGMKEAIQTYKEQEKRSKATKALVALEVVTFFVGKNENTKIAATVAFTITSMIVCILSAEKNRNTEKNLRRRKKIISKREIKEIKRHIQITQSPSGLIFLSR